MTLDLLQASASSMVADQKPRRRKKIDEPALIKLLFWKINMGWRYNQKILGISTPGCLSNRPGI